MIKFPDYDGQAFEVTRDAHAIKREYLGRKAKISLYDLAVDKKTGIIYIVDKAGRIVAETIYKSK